MSSGVHYLNPAARARDEKSMNALMALAKVDPLEALRYLNDAIDNAGHRGLLFNELECRLFLMGQLAGICSAAQDGHKMAIEELAVRLQKYWQDGVWSFALYPGLRHATQTEKPR